MDSVTTPSIDPELHLLTDWGTGGLRTRWRDAAVGSVVAHLALLTLLAMLPSGVFKAPRRVIARTQVTPLIAPFELTQPDPNKGKISKSVNMESLLPRPSIKTPRTAPSTTRPAARTPGEQGSASIAPPALSPKPAPAAPQIAEPPKIDTGALNDGALSKLPIGMPQAPPQIQEEEKPKLAFENPGAPSSGPRQGSGKIPVPTGGVSEAIRTMARSGSGGVTVGDVGIGAGGIGEGMNLPPSPGKIGSNLELLSDPMGVDFRPYMVQVLAAVRRNWFAIMPESAKLGSRGKVALQFSVDRGGRVPKLVIVTPSGIQALDRAAVAGVSASNPFPPLPTEFRGTQIRLQLVFSYNTPSN